MNRHGTIKEVPRFLGGEQTVGFRYTVLVRTFSDHQEIHGDLFLLYLLASLLRESQSPREVIHGFNGNLIDNSPPNGGGVD